MVMKDIGPLRGGDCEMVDASATELGLTTEADDWVEHL